MKDKIFLTPNKRKAPFEFSQEVANVFDDMINRSIPFYREIHQLISDVVLRQYQFRGNIVDLGCSTGTTISLLENIFTTHYGKEAPPSFIGLDSSAPMLKKAQEKCTHVRNVQFIKQDILLYPYENAEIIILNYTLQFLKLKEREKLLKKIHKALLPGGIILISEKITSPHPLMQEMVTDLYYDFKRRNGYSELEISQKREALENVLIPITPQEQIEMLENSGFKDSEMLFRWYNFASYMGIKRM